MADVLGKLTFIDTPDVNGALVLTDTTGINSITGTANQISISGSLPSYTVALSSNAVLPGTGSVTIPTGTTAQRPASPTVGMERWNTTLGYAELYNGSVWQPYGRVLQMVSGTIAATTGTTQVSTALTTAPTTSDGFQIWTQSFTPISASSRILVQFSLTTSASTNARTVILSCFAGSTNIGSTAQLMATANSPYIMGYSVIHSPASTAAITFTCRIGPTAATTVAVSQVNTTTGTLGGAAATEFTIMEIL